MEVEIYSKTNCSFCEKAKIRLQQHNPIIHMLDKDYSRDQNLKVYKFSLLYMMIYSFIVIADSLI